MASTWAGTTQSEFLTRAAIYDAVVNVGDVMWRTSAPSGWSSSGRWVTWIELQDAIQLDPGAPGEDVNNGGDPETDPDWNRWPAKASLLLYLPEPSSAPTVAPSNPVLTVESGGVLRATWTNTGNFNARVQFLCLTNPALNHQRQDITPGQTTTTYAPGNFTTETFAFWAQYFNDDGSGPQSSMSNQVQSDINM